MSRRTWISPYDLVRVVEKLRQGKLERVLSSLSLRKRDDRTKETWKTTDASPVHWGSLPFVHERWSELVSGERETTIRSYVAEKYLQPLGNDLTAVSLGCGTGSNEIAWGKTGIFSRIDASDISADRIEQAKRKADEEGVGEIVQFSVADARSVSLPEKSYDVVLAINALHHFDPVEPVVRQFRGCLRKDGLLILRDYVGPSRFQWTREQLDAAKAVLALLPKSYRRRGKSGTLKKRCYRPSMLSMILSDPSEAARSEEILGAVRTHFQPAEEKELGGALMHLLLKDISHHFRSEAGERWLQLIASIEDELMREGVLESDFVFGVYEAR